MTAGEVEARQRQQRELQAELDRQVQEKKRQRVCLHARLCACVRVCACALRWRCVVTTDVRCSLVAGAVQAGAAGPMPAPLAPLPPTCAPLATHCAATCMCARRSWRGSSTRPRRGGRRNALQQSRRGSRRSSAASAMRSARISASAAPAPAAALGLRPAAACLLLQSRRTRRSGSSSSSSSEWAACGSRCRRRADLLMADGGEPAVRACPGGGALGCTARCV
jgi:hypothetical protein